jgi:hypothetical protein
MTSVGIVPETLAGGRRFGSYSVQPSKRPAPSSKSETEETTDGELETWSVMRSRMLRYFLGTDY